jgi:hypothetical protein
MAQKDEGQSRSGSDAHDPLAPCENTRTTSPRMPTGYADNCFIRWCQFSPNDRSYVEALDLTASSRTVFGMRIGSASYTHHQSDGAAKYPKRLR